MIAINQIGTRQKRVGGCNNQTGIKKQERKATNQIYSQSRQHKSEEQNKYEEQNWQSKTF